MQHSYFKLRQPLNFKPHKYEIGRPFFYRKSAADNFFCLRVYGLDESEYPDFYDFHLRYFLKHSAGNEKEFFQHVYDVVNNRINYFSLLNPFESSYARRQELQKKLKAFLVFLHSIDKWNHHKSLEVLIAEKDREISELNEKIAELSDQIKVMKQYESSEKISITEGRLATAIDLLLQLQELKPDGGKKLFSSQTQSPWYKMLARYFTHGNKEIPINTARNYFPASKNVKLIKGSEITDSDKIFFIRKKD